MKNKDSKGCLCRNKKHHISWHCIVRRKHPDKRPDIIRADFPFLEEPTTNTGDWLEKHFHLIKNWGKKR